MGRRAQTPDGAVTPDLLLVRGFAAAGAIRDLALSQALLERVAGRSGAPDPVPGARAAARLYRPTPTVAFGRVDTFRPGFAESVEVARRHGFDPVVRAPGGRAAAYHERSLVLEIAIADPDPRAGIAGRFAAMADLVVEALRRLGVPATTGELPGEYCPGPFSVLAGGVKLGGTAQRVIAGGALTGIAVVVEDGARVRSVLEAVSGALDYAFDPATAGSVTDVVPGVTVADVERELERALAARYQVRAWEPDAALGAAAAEREAEHLPIARTRSRPTG
jgi:lipoate-protein ligase A